jgi:putative ATPase
MPEAGLALAQAIVYLALAPKSNALYTAYGAAQEDVEKTAAEPVPLHIRNAVTKLMKQVGYGKGYQYAHDLDEKVADMECMPDNLRGREYYHPTQEGREKMLAQRMEEIRQRKEELRRSEESSASAKSKPVKRRGKEEQS